MEFVDQRWTGHGSIGVLEKVIYLDDKEPSGLPSYILVNFPDYKGPCILDRLFSIVSVLQTWIMDTYSYQRTQIPVSLSHAITVHKAQSLTIDKVVTDVRSSEKSPGIVYTALTRYRRRVMLHFHAYILNRVMTRLVKINNTKKSSKLYLNFKQRVCKANIGDLKSSQQHTT